MRKIFLIILFFPLISLADYPDLKKISKNNTFMDALGKPYSIEKIKDVENILLIMWNHGSGEDAKKDKCKLKPGYGFEWEGSPIPAILELHNKKVNDLTIKVFRLCSGVKGMSVKDQKKIRKELKKNKKMVYKLNLFPEFKQLKRQNIILDKAEEFTKLGFKNIVLAGHSAGAWASLNLISRFPNQFKGVIAMSPAFAGPKKEWQKKYPEWGLFRNYEVSIFQKNHSLNALLFSHSNDVYEDPKTLSFFKDFNNIEFIDFSVIKPTDCDWADVEKKMSKNDGHSIDQSSCFTKFIKKNNYYISYLESLF